MKEKILRRMPPAIVALTLIVSIGMNAAPLQSVYAASSNSGTWIKESNGRLWYKHRQ